MSKKNQMDPLVRQFLMDKYLLSPQDENLAPVPFRDEPEVQSSWQPASVPETIPPISEPPSPLKQGSRLADARQNLSKAFESFDELEKSIGDDLRNSQKFLSEAYKPTQESTPGTPSLYYDQSAIDKEMRDAQTSMRDNLQTNNMMRAVSTIGGAIAGVKPDSSFYDNMDKQAGMDIEQLKERRKFELENINRQQVEAKMDPKSNVSKNVREAYKKMAPELVGKIPDFEFLSAFDIENNLAKPLELYQRAQDRRLQQEMMMDYRRDMVAGQRDARAIQREERQAIRAEQRDQKLNANVQKLSEKLAPAQQMSNVLTNIESQLGFSIDDAQIKDGKLMVKGKEKDLPGVSVPGIGRVSFYDSDARLLKGALDKVFNIELKDRSGAAVTVPELERLKSEFASGKFNTEPEMIKALQDYKRIVQSQFKNRLAGFDPDVVERYKSQEGQVDVGGKKQGSSSRQVVKKMFSPSRNKTKIVYSDGTEEVVDGQR